MCNGFLFAIAAWLILCNCDEEKDCCERRPVCGKRRSPCCCRHEKDCDRGCGCGSDTQDDTPSGCGCGQVRVVRGCCG